MTNRQKGLYFAHPKNTYDKDLETKILQAIQEKFPDTHIINPNSPEHQDGFERYRASGGNPMLYFDVEVLPWCTGAVNLPFRDGMWGAGVYKEMLGLFVLEFPIWKVDHLGNFTEMKGMPGNCLTVNETRRRIKLPYDQALPLA